MSNLINKLGIILSDTMISDLSFELVKDNVDTSSFNKEKSLRYLKIIELLKDKPKKIDEISDLLKGENNVTLSKENLKNDINYLILTGFIFPKVI